MKRSALTLLALLLALVMTAGVFASCGGNSSTEAETTTAQGAETSEETTSSDVETTEETETTAQSSSETAESTSDETAENTESSDTAESSEATEETTEASEETTEETTEKVIEAIENEHTQLIEHNADLANGVQAYFSDSTRKNFVIKNQEMFLDYMRSSAGDQQVASLTNTKGNVYVQNTMDVFVRMTDGSTHYASQSGKSAEVNLYRFGYYYYEALFEFQDFVPETIPTSNGIEIPLNKFYENRDTIKRSTVKDAGNPDGKKAMFYEVASVDDPYFFFTDLAALGINGDTHDYLVITAKVVGDCTGAQLFVASDGNSGRIEEGSKTDISFNDDGEWHTYYIDLKVMPTYGGKLQRLRFDPNGSVGSGLIISNIEVCHGELADSVPTGIAINRHFHVYSDKMHQAIQFATTAKTENIEAFGMLTKIDASTVASIMILDKNGTHTSLDEVDWDSVEGVAFDIKDTGIFGYIMPNDAVAGKIKVELVNGEYVIEQTLVPENGTILPSISGTLDAYGNHTHAAGVKNNGNDLYLSQRIYTDESHDFAEFLFETYCERNPLSDTNIRVKESNSDSGMYLGYDAMRGAYTLSVGGPSAGFFSAYNLPNKNYKLNFNIVALKEDRDIYIVAKGSGILECATLMDKDMLMLPVQIEVIKNFSEPTGERNLFNISDPTFGESIFSLTLEANTKYEYTLINLFQNWGNFPLKQLSSIPFHCPYYHLSTGVVETNCILPWFGTSSVGKSGAGNTLPDFRSMSAPFWQGQPQHNSCGTHYWLQYTDSEGRSCAVESIENVITSHGPTYAEVIMHNISDDGKIKVDYTHMEMPQTDENRTYYTMEYEFVEDLTITNFKNDFQFYKVTDNNATGSYKRIGYLDENNEYKVASSTTSSTEPQEFILGDECPYFSFYCMPDWDRNSTSAEGYSNVAFLIYNSKFIINGEEVTPNFVIVNTPAYVRLTLDLGEVNFKAGDKITINAIALPWGSQQYEDGIWDPEKGNYEYDYVINEETGEKYEDKNVRDVRENTLVNPAIVTSETDKIVESAFLPRVSSADGKTATFTLSGGHNNVTVRVDNFARLTAPVVEEYVNGEWVEYVLSSKNNPDVKGFYHYYDGYGVHYNEDGTYSYSFVVEMDNGAPRTFRITADTVFKGWPEEFLPELNPDYLKVYIDPEEIKAECDLQPGMYGTAEVKEEDGLKYVRILSNPKQAAEAYTQYYKAESSGVETGQYMVLMYRVPETNTEAIGWTQFYASTSTESYDTAQDAFSITAKADGKWHVEVWDLSKSNMKRYIAGDDGKFYANKMRIDWFNKQLPEGTAIDVAFVGIDSDLSAICQLEQVAEDFEFITLYEKGVACDVDVALGEKYVPTYFVPGDVYTEQADLAYGSIIDSIGGNKVSLNSYRCRAVVSLYQGVSVPSATNLKITVAGWCIVDGGVNKYVWSADGGKTWNDCGGNNTLADGSNEMLSVARYGGAQTYGDGSLKNGKFQAGNGALVIDLAEYAGKTVNVILGAVPESNTSSVLPLYCFEDVACFVPSRFVEESPYKESSRPFLAQTDYVNGAGKYLLSAYNEVTPKATITAGADGKVMLSGWAVVSGGISKYVWTADNGATWHDFDMGHVCEANDAILNYGESKLNITFPSRTSTAKNARFQGENTGIIMDVSEYTSAGSPLHIYVAAIPVEEPDRVCVLFDLTVNMP